MRNNASQIAIIVHFFYYLFFLNFNRVILSWRSIFEQSFRLSKTQKRVVHIVIVDLSIGESYKDMAIAQIIFYQRSIHYILKTTLRIVFELTILKNTLHFNLTNKQFSFLLMLIHQSTKFAPHHHTIFYTKSIICLFTRIPASGDHKLFYNLFIYQLIACYKINQSSN